MIVILGCVEIQREIYTVHILLDLSCHGRSVDNKIYPENFGLRKDIKDSAVFSKKGFVLPSF